MDYQLGDNFLASLSQLLSRGPITAHEVMVGIDELLGQEEN